MLALQSFSTITFIDPPLCLHYRLNELKRYRKKDVTLSLPEGKTLSNIKWFAVWCEEFKVSGHEFPLCHYNIFSPFSCVLFLRDKHFFFFFLRNSRVKKKVFTTKVSFFFSSNWDFSVPG